MGRRSAPFAAGPAGRRPLARDRQPGAHAPGKGDGAAPRDRRRAKRLGDMSIPRDLAARLVALLPQAARFKVPVPAALFGTPPFDGRRFPR